MESTTLSDFVGDFSEYVWRAEATRRRKPLERSHQVLIDAQTEVVPFLSQALAIPKKAPMSWQQPCAVTQGGEPWLL
jgi:hypothetical protein